MFDKRWESAHSQTKPQKNFLSQNPIPGLVNTLP
jgi:hypothetical protein